MRINLLFLLLASLLFLPTSHAQVLTEVRDNPLPTTEEIRRSRLYAIGGSSFRLDLGYQEMNDFIEDQGFDFLRPTIAGIFGVGINLSDQFSVELLAEATQDSETVTSGGTKFTSQVADIGVHALLGYQAWQKRHKSLYVQAGGSGLLRAVGFTERRPANFDFNNVNSADRPTVTSWPVFNHTQGALHFGLQLKINYPRPRGIYTDLDLRLGFVTGLGESDWAVERGQVFNAPTDNAQYIYFSSTVHIFRERRVRG